MRRKQMTKTPNITDFQRLARINNVLEVLIRAKIKSNLLLETIRLGYPFFTDGKSCPTSAVTITPDGRIRYIWNREFFDKCSDLAVQYICMHEALHVVLNHLLRREDRNPILWNVAADAVINNILDIFYTSESHRLPPNYCDLHTDKVLETRVNPSKIRKDLSIYNLDRVSTEQIYDLLNTMMCKQQQGQQGQSGDDTKSDGKGGNEKDENGKSGDEENGKTGDEKENGKSGPAIPEIDNYGNLDVHDWDKNSINPQTQKVLDDLREEAREETNSGRRSRRTRGKGWGDLPGGMEAELHEVEKDYCVPWSTLLKCNLHSTKRLSEADNWSRPHRKMFSSYPDILLPGPHENIVQTALVLVAIDTSGSMEDEQIAELVGIVQTLPEDKYDIRIVWFDTKLYEASDLTRPYGRGGTSFQAIENVAKGELPIYPSDYRPYSHAPHEQQFDPEGNKLDTYPDLVVVMTDGEAMTPTLEHPNRWTFVITKEGMTDYVEPLTESSVWRL
jgi:predicted metal-dependent peptidase